MGGTKHDQQKPRFDLIDAQFDLEVIGAGDWQRGTEKGQDLRDWAVGNDGASIKRVFWYVATLYNTDNSERTARLELARVLGFGAEKYSANNWKDGFKWSRLWRAAYGHIEAHKAGDVYDEETGFLHLSHALCCLMFLIVHERDGLGEDDRSEIWPAAGGEAPGPPVAPQTLEVATLGGFVYKQVILFDSGKSDEAATWRCANLNTQVTVWRDAPGYSSGVGQDPMVGKLLSDDGKIAEMREKSWPEVVGLDGFTQVQYESGCGVHFKLESVDALIAHWRCMVSGAYGYVKRDKTWHWLSRGLATKTDVKATGCYTTRSSLVAASWPSD